MPERTAHFSASRVEIPGFQTTCVQAGSGHYSHYTAETEPMEYAIIIYETEKDFASRNNQQQGPYWASWTSFLESMQSAGINTGGNALQAPETGTTVRVREDKRSIHDGPFADSKEQLGGFIVIDVPSLDEALEWAARCPAAASCGVEIRPVLAMG